MADAWGGLYAPPAEAVIEDGLLEVFGDQPGPAGVSAVDFADGSRWEVDHAEPHRLVRIEAPAGDPIRSPLLVTAFGGDGALLLADRAASADHPEIDDLHAAVADLRAAAAPPTGAAPDSSHDAPWASRASGRSVPRPMSRPRRLEDPGLLVLLDDLALDRSLHPLSRLGAVAELTTSRGSARGGELFDEAVEELAAQAGALAAGVDDDDLRRLPDQVLDELVVALLRAQKHWALPGNPVGDLSERARSVVDDRRRDGGPSRGGDEPRRRRADLAMYGRLAQLQTAAQIDLAAMETPAGPGRPELERVEPALLRVRVEDPAAVAGHRWVRVLRRPGMAPLGQAPLRPDPRSGRPDGAVADVVVPPDVTPADLAVSVVDESDLTLLSGRPVQLVRAAVQAGRSAARSTRLRDRSAAIAGWDRCAGLWEAAGDHRRAEQARRLGSSNRSGSSVGATVTDRVEAVLAGR